MEVQICDKALLTLKEAAAYFHIGINKLRDMTNQKCCEPYVLFKGRTRLIKRVPFEDYLNAQFSI